MQMKTNLWRMEKLGPKKIKNYEDFLSVFVK